MKTKRVLGLLLAAVLITGCLAAGLIAYAAKVEQQFESRRRAALGYRA